uniref:DC1 domain-containing protein n=1 Tax=Oryza punctata TaxID=4537 RepID=A0A0E0LUM2_ORYPU
MTDPVPSESEHLERSTAESWMEEVSQQLCHDVQHFLEELSRNEGTRRLQVIADIEILKARAKEATQRYKIYNNNLESNDCVLPTPGFGDPPVEITHQFHPAHKLRLADTDTDGGWPSRCGGCKELAAGRRRYTCEPCNLTLYTCCATAARTLQHPLLPGRHFRLLEQPPPPPPWLTDCGWACDACGDLLRADGFAYHCTDEHGLGLNLHPRCARLPVAARAVARYDAVELRKVASSGRCSICMSGEDGYRHRFWSYRFSGGDDEFVDVHMSCLKELASQSHETLTNLYEILMDGPPWMPTNNWGEGTSGQVNSSGISKGKMPARKEGDAGKFQYNNGVNNTMAMAPDTKTITHPSHPEHKLQLVTTTGEAPFLCDSCKEPGDGPRYHCNACDFDMHNFCAHAPAKLRHYDLFKGRTFKLLAEPPPGPPETPHPAGGDGRWCDTCGDPIKGLVYHCSGANLDLHPCCASLDGAKTKITLDGVAFDIAEHRKCGLCSSSRREEGRHCCRLRHREQWWYYHSTGDVGDGETTVYIHVACVKQIARMRWQAARDMKCGAQIMLASDEMMKEGGPLEGIPSERARMIVGAVVRIIIAVIFGDRTAIEGDVRSWSALNLQWLTDLLGIQI